MVSRNCFPIIVPARRMTPLLNGRQREGADQVWTAATNSPLFLDSGSFALIHWFYNRNGMALEKEEFFAIFGDDSEHAI